MFKELKILQITDRYCPYIGGVEKVVQALAEGLSQNNVKVSILTRKQTKDLKDVEIINNVYVYRVRTIFCDWYDNKKKVIKDQIAKSRNKNLIKPLLFLKLFLFCLVYTPLKKATVLGSIYFVPLLIWLSKKCDVIHIHKTDIFVAPSILFAKLFNKKLVVTFHAYVPSQFELFDKRMPLNWPINRFLREKVNFIYVSEYLGQILIETLHFDKKRIFHIPNAVRLPFVKDVENWFENEKRDKVIFIGRLYDSQKDISTLFKAWKIVIQQEGVKLYVIGDGADCEKLKKLANDLLIQDSVIFVGEIQDTQFYIKSARLFCLPSLYEGLSIALLECMAWALPCVVSDIPGNKELINNGVNGLTFEVGNYNQLAEKILFLLKNTDKAKEFGMQARQTVEERYNIEQSVRRHIDLYNMVASN